jgi:Secretion system C-terminal sorting domain
MKTTFTTFKALVFTITFLFGFQISFNQTPGQDSEKRDIKFKLKPIKENIFLPPDSVDYSIHNLGIVAPNYWTPYSQVECFNFGTSVGWLEDSIVNFIYFDFNLIENNGGNLVYFDSFYYDGPNIVCLSNILTSECYTPSTTLNSYTGYYYFKTGADEFNMSNNYDTIRFAVTDGTFSKENGATHSFVPDDDEWEGVGEPHSWAFGNYYYIVNGSDHPENYRAESVTFSIGDVGNPELIGRLITIYLYKWENDDNQNELMDPDERTRVGFSIYKINGNETLSDLITLPLYSFPDGGEGPVNIDSDQAYIVMVEYSTNDEVNFSLAVNASINYSPMTRNTYLLGMTRFGSFIGVNGDLDSEPFWRFVSAGNTIVPVVRLNITRGDIVDNTSNTLPPENKLNISPNPTNSSLNIEIDLVESQKEATIKIYDLNGRVLTQKSYNNIKYEKINFDLTKFVDGIYILHFATDGCIRTERFVVHHR